MPSRYRVLFLERELHCCAHCRRGQVFLGFAKTGLATRMISMNETLLEALDSDRAQFPFFNERGEYHQKHTKWVLAPLDIHPMADQQRLELPR